MSTKYSVAVTHFAESHYIKSFQKDYKKAWNVTWKAIHEELKRFDSLLDTTIATVICGDENIKIAKSEFKIAGTNTSRKTSGNRCIIAVNIKTMSVIVLLVYSKNHLGNGNETVKWKSIIKSNYPEYNHLL